LITDVDQYRETHPREPTLNLQSKSSS